VTADAMAQQVGVGAAMPVGPWLLVVLLPTGLGALVASIIDIRSHRLPDAIVAPMWALACGAMVAATAMGVDPFRLRGAVVGGLVAVVALGMGWLLGMGFGDVKFGGVLGMVLGWSAGGLPAAAWAALGMMAMASVASVVWVAVQVAMGRRGAREPYAYGPWLAGAAAMVLALDGFGVVG